MSVSIFEKLKRKILGKKYRCKNCHKEFRGNKRECPSCNHTVFEKIE